MSKKAENKVEVSITSQGYVPPQGYFEKANKPEDMFVVAPSLESDGVSLGDFKDYMRDYAELDRVAKLVKEKQDAIKAVVLDGVKALGVTKLKNDYGTFTYIPESSTERFDSKALKEDSPKLYNLYVVASNKKEYLKVTPKKPKKAEKED